METQVKRFDIDDLKVDNQAEGCYITGIANNKGKVDAYGDIPTGKNVYDLTRYSKNPVVLADHNNSVGCIVGRMVKIKETDKGLEFKMRLMDNPQTDIAKHAIEAYKNGFGHALSIGGIWEYGKENPDRTRELIKATIHEISLVGVGADGEALTDVPGAKSSGQEAKEQPSVDLTALMTLSKGLRELRMSLLK